MYAIGCRRNSSLTLLPSGRKRQLEKRKRCGMLEEGEPLCPGGCAWHLWWHGLGRHMKLICRELEVSWGV